MRQKERLKAEGKLANAERDLAQYAMKQADNMKRAAAAQRKEAALNILRRDELESRIIGFMEETGNPVESFQALLAGSHKSARGARQSIDAQRVGIRNRQMGQIMAELDAIQKEHGLDPVRLMARDKDFERLVIQEMHEIKPEGRPGVSGDPVAQRLADMFARHLEVSRQRLNRAGANIGKLHGYVPQSHDAAKVIGADKSEWVEFVAARLDRARTFADKTDDEVRDILAKTYDDIVTGRPRDVSARERGEFVGPRNLARSLERSRVLHFKDADAFLEYHRAFGRGHIFEAVVKQLDGNSRKIALMETLGPNPENMLNSLIESVKRKVGYDNRWTPAERAKIIAKLEGGMTPGFGSGGILDVYRAIAGDISNPVNISRAKKGATLRATQTLSKLGGATLSAVGGDWLTVGMNARYNGMNLFGTYRYSLDRLFRGKSSDEVRSLSYSLGTFYDGVLNEVAARWDAQDEMFGRLSDWQNKLFKWSGLTYWTEAMKAGYASAFSNKLALLRGIDFANLDETASAILRHHGVDAAKWDAMRAMTDQAADGRLYLLPEMAHEIDDSLIDAIAGDRIGKARDEAHLDRIRQDVRARLETDLMAMIADETKFAIIEPDSRTRAAMTMGTRPGSLLGELVRFVTQFKSFPIAYFQRNMRSGRWGQVAGKGYDSVAIAQTVALTLVLGYASATAKDMAKGRTPADPRKWETWTRSAMQSGGAGIYGDFLFAKRNRFGGGIVDTLAGPVIGEATDVAEEVLAGARDVGKLAVGSDAGMESDPANLLRSAWDNMPFVNLWYTRMALDYAVGYHISELVSPGYLKRMEKRMKEESNQEFIYSPRKVLGY